MPDKKLTDSEIVKALECCGDEMGCKKGCPCFDPKSKSSHCTAIGDNGLEKLALDLINRLQEEKEALINGQETLQKHIADLQAENEQKDKNYIDLLQTSSERAEIIGKQNVEIMRLQADSSRLKKVQMQLDDLCKMHNIIKFEAYQEFAEKAIEQVEKVRQKYQRLCKEQGEEMEEHMHIHFNGIIGIINNLLKETYNSSVAEATPSPPNKGEG